MGESFILRNQIWKNGLPGGWSTKTWTNIQKKLKIGGKIVEKTEKFQ
jgi:hypothetical protein